MHKLTALILALMLAISQRLACAASPPAQPKSGPGGSDYAHLSVQATKHGADAAGYWIFEPAHPRPNSAPVIVFNHGFGASDPRSYGAWISHLVRKGNAVIYPIYQHEDKFRYPPSEITSNAIEAVKQALQKLNGTEHIKGELGKFAVVGHSAGGQISANMAATWKEAGLPQPKAVMCVEPGKSWNAMERMRIPLADMSRIAAGTLLLVVAGEEDKIARDTDAKKIYIGATSVQKDDKDLLLLRSDYHGEPPLVANHFAPAARDAALLESEDKGLVSANPSRPRIAERLRKAGRQGKAREAADEVDLIRADEAGKPDALDFYGFWKLFDGLYQAAFFGRHREFALGGTSQQKSMGIWSDGVPVKEIEVM